MSHPEWTTHEIHRLLTVMRACLSWAEVASKMPGRSAGACSQRAHRFGHYLQGPHTGPSRMEVRVIRQRHAEGWSDMDIAIELGCCRRKITGWRRKLGLASNSHNQRHREKTRLAMQRQIKEDGHRTLAALQQAVRAADAWRQGWPVDCTPIMVQILDHLERGPSTRRAFCEATGRRYCAKAVQTTKGKSAFYALVQRGYVRRNGRVQFAPGKGMTEFQYELVIKRRAANLGRGVFAGQEEAA
jgi:hypothetical protein